MAEDRVVKYLTIKEFAALHEGRIALSSIGEQVRRGQLPHIRYGRRVYIPDNALDVMRERQEAERQAAWHTTVANSTNHSTNTTHRAKP